MADEGGEDVLGAFLFGNLDAKGQADEDYLDEVCCAAEPVLL